MDPIFLYIEANRERMFILILCIKEKRLTVKEMITQINSTPFNTKKFLILNKCGMPKIWIFSFIRGIFAAAN